MSPFESTKYTEVSLSLLPRTEITETWSQAGIAFTINSDLEFCSKV